MNNHILHKASERGHADHGWLDTYHSFSFAGYQDPKRMNFGVLRVLNDDTVAGGRGFGTHPHENMEIISIPLKGSLEHNDSMGNGGIIRPGEVQIMSAGTGIQHSEFNPDADITAEFFQIWLFPHTLDVKPRYQQITMKEADRKNQWDQILSPDKDAKEGWIHQDAWFQIADLKKDHSLSYNLKKVGNGIYMMVVEGKLTINDHTLERRDAIGILNTEEIQIKSTEDSQILLMEVPMQLPNYLRK